MTVCESDSVVHRCTFAIVVNPPERKVAKRTSVQCTKVVWSNFSLNVGHKVNSSFYYSKLLANKFWYAEFQTLSKLQIQFSYKCLEKSGTVDTGTHAWFFRVLWRHMEIFYILHRNAWNRILWIYQCSHHLSKSPTYWGLVHCADAVI